MGTTTLLTFEQFEKLPDSPGKHELLDGELMEMPPVKRSNSDIQLRIQERLRPYILERNLGEVYVEAGYQLGKRHYVQPDVSLASSEQREASDPDGYMDGAPRLAIEVISA